MAKAKKETDPDLEIILDMHTARVMTERTFKEFWTYEDVFKVYDRMPLDAEDAEIKEFESDLKASKEVAEEVFKGAPIAIADATVKMYDRMFGFDDEDDDEDSDD